MPKTTLRRNCDIFWVFSLIVLFKCYDKVLLGGNLSENSGKYGTLHTKTAVRNQHREYAVKAESHAVKMTGKKIFIQSRLWPSML